jgi:hypothetical protein
VTVYTVVIYKTGLAGKKQKEPGAAGRQFAGRQAGRHIAFL